jgi:hypothetical protein
VPEACKEPFFLVVFSTFLSPYLSFGPQILSLFQFHLISSNPIYREDNAQAHQLHFAQRSPNDVADLEILLFLVLIGHSEQLLFK